MDSWTMLLGKEVWTGTGELLGRVVALLPRHGTPKTLVVEQPEGGKEWHVETEHVKRISDRIELKGPREGFHIAPLRPVARATL